MKKFNIILCVALINAHIVLLHATNIGFLVVATGKYIQFVEPLLASADMFFCTQDSVTYFVFTDMDFVYHGPRKCIVTYQQHRIWPYATLLRCETYMNNSVLFEEMDYLFASDADMRFVAPVGNEILSQRVATQHPGYVGNRGTYETRSASLAYVDRSEGTHYFAGGFYGGSKVEFLIMAQIMTHNIYADLKNKIIAIWHDESHLNRYFIDHAPTKILSPSYCYPANRNLPYVKRLLALVKNHEEIR